MTLNQYERLRSYLSQGEVGPNPPPRRIPGFGYVEAPLPTPSVLGTWLQNIFSAAPPDTTPEFRAVFLAVEEAWRTTSQYEFTSNYEWPEVIDEAVGFLRDMASRVPVFPLDMEEFNELLDLRLGLEDMGPRWGAIGRNTLTSIDAMLEALLGSRGTLYYHDLGKALLNAGLEWFTPLDTGAWVPRPELWQQFFDWWWTEINRRIPIRNLVPELFIQ